MVDEFTGGIWWIRQYGYSTLNFSGGEIHWLYLNSYSQAILSGGRIDEIWSYQGAIPDPHIEIVCRPGWFHDTNTNILTGTWFDDTTFSIQLVDVTGYSPTFDNIFITPEPMTLLLVSIGGLFLRRRRNKYNS